ncbi:spore protease YyaC [uncultured Clostridium sp.]|uniref:spore protease YyaC n=1 Tax=uncultured Clostridium sp. TaxID=59620 RepID=UPI002604B3D8|nr:spore protease YyaC [uncultured Clostridium sp.]
MKEIINITSKNPDIKLGTLVKDIIKEDLIIVCIGTDKFIGDALGPIVGSILTEYKFPFPVYGTIHDPIHALNLDTKINEIKKKHKSSFIVAIDACLGTKSEVGDIYLRDTPISPGRGVGKLLTEVGDISIVGIIAKSASEDFLYSNNIRLSLVYDIANIISKGLINAYNQWLFRYIDSNMH